MATATGEDQKKKVQPELVKLDRGFKLAEQWVNNMGKGKSSVAKKSTPVELEGRPPRKLHSMLHAQKRKAAKRDEDPVPSTKDGNDDEDSEEDESESKTKAFAKKRRPSWPPSPLPKKKKHR